MRHNSISVLLTRKHKVTTNTNHNSNVAPNLRDHGFMTDLPNQKWGDDIPYIWIREG